MMLIDRSIMMSSANLHALLSLLVVNHHQEKRLLQLKLRMRNLKMKATCKSSMTDSQSQKNSDKLTSSLFVHQTRVVQAKMNEHALSKSI